VICGYDDHPHHYSHSYQYIRHHFAPRATHYRYEHDKAVVYGVQEQEIRNKNTCVERDETCSGCSVRSEIHVEPRDERRGNEEEEDDCRAKPLPGEDTQGGRIYDKGCVKVSALKVARISARREALREGKARQRGTERRGSEQTKDERDISEPTHRTTIGIQTNGDNNDGNYSNEP